MTEKQPEQQPLQAWTDEEYIRMSGKLADLCQSLRSEKAEAKESAAEYREDIKNLEKEIDELSKELRQQRVARKKVEAA